MINISNPNPNTNFSNKPLSMAETNNLMDTLGKRTSLLAVGGIEQRDFTGNLIEAPIPKISDEMREALQNPKNKEKLERILRFDHQASRLTKFVESGISHLDSISLNGKSLIDEIDSQKDHLDYLAVHVTTSQQIVNYNYAMYALPRAGINLLDAVTQKLQKAIKKIDKKRVELAKILLEALGFKFEKEKEAKKANALKAQKEENKQEAEALKAKTDETEKKDEISSTPVDTVAEENKTII